jgi:hypothetical protein
MNEYLTQKCNGAENNTDCDSCLSFNECIKENESQIMTNEQRIELRQKNNNRIAELEQKYSSFNSFEIFKPLQPNYPNYTYRKQIEYFNILFKQFNIDKNRITIRFNKTDIDIYEVDKIVTMCHELDIRIQKYVTLN